MLIAIPSGKEMTKVPYERGFNTLRNRLSIAEFEAMVGRVNELIDASGAEIVTAGWLPGSNWAGTVFEPIYTKAARQDYDRSAVFCGQLVWYTVMNRPEMWSSGRYEKDGVDIGSRTYFRVGD